jgi:putative ABC transport system substrate-binding protein
MTLIIMVVISPFFHPGTVDAKTVGVILPRDCAYSPDTKDDIAAHLIKQGFSAKDFQVFQQRPAADKISRLNSMRKYIAFGVEVMVVWGSTSIKEISRESGKTPIVFVGAYDPVGDGIVKSLQEPGGYFTGILGKTSTSFLLDNIVECVGPGKVGVIYHSDVNDSVAQVRELEKVAAKKGISLVKLDFSAGGFQKAPAAFADVKFIYFAQGCDVEGGTFKLLEKIGKPVATQNPGITGSGVVFTLAPDMNETVKAAADLAGRILKGEKPGKIPVGRVKKINFTINMGEARKLGLKIPFSVLNRGTEIIR